MQINLLGALVNPRANQSHLIPCESFGRRTKSAGTSRSAVAVWRRPAGRRSATGTAGTAGTAGTTRTVFGRHGGLVIELCRGDHQEAFLTIAGDDSLAVFAAF